LQANAEEEAMEVARLMIEGARAARKYTVDEIKPLLARLPGDEFLPQSVPAYAAGRNLDHVRELFTEYSYKEAVLNPTNPSHRATDWETDLVEYFRNHPDADSLPGRRQTPTGDYLYLSHPIRVGSAACLSCHGAPQAAPAAMVKRYGSSNGFGWQLNEVVGAQVVSVPLSVPLARADRAFYTFMGSLLALFLALAVILNLLLNRVVLGPVRRLSEAAEAVSMGNFEVADVEIKGKDEIAQLAGAFRRMRRSLDNALNLLSRG